MNSEQKACPHKVILCHSNTRVPLPLFYSEVPPFAAIFMLSVVVGWVGLGFCFLGAYVLPPQANEPPEKRDKITFLVAFPAPSTALYA